MRKERFGRILAGLCLAYFTFSANSTTQAATTAWATQDHPTVAATDTIVGVKADSRNDVLIAGNQETRSSGKNRALLAKYASASGVLLWQQDGPNMLTGINGLAVDSQDDALVTGIVKGTGNFGDIATAKYSSKGKLRWKMTRAGDNGAKGNAIAVDRDDNVLIAGYTTQGFTDCVYAAKYNGQTGEVLWENITPAPGGGVAIVLDKAGNAYITGQSGVFKLAGDTGEMLWNASMGPYEYIAIDHAGNPVVAGSDPYSFSEEGGIVYHLKVARLQGKTGIVLWKYTLMDRISTGATGVAVDAHNDVFVIGHASSTKIDFNDAYYTAKIDCTSGKVLWDQYFTQGIQNSTSGLVVTPKGDVVVTGWVDPSYSLPTQYFTIAYSGVDGTPLDAVPYLNPNNGGSYASGITLDNAGRAIVTGTSLDALGGNTALTIKYGPEKY